MEVKVSLDFYKIADLHFWDMKFDFPTYMVEKSRNYQVRE